MVYQAPPNELKTPSCTIYYSIILHLLFYILFFFGILGLIKRFLKKYNTNIFVLVPGTNIKENFKKELLFCTGETYLKYQDDTLLMNENEISELNQT